jgi:hypothetical protein
MSDEKPMTEATTRLFAIVAREARVAVVFRRGPSKSVRMIRWDLASDAITLGQWLWGRVYQERCGISPDGKLVVYFCGKFGTKLGTFTAVCRPPFFTALALWPEGSTYGGGGFFPDNKQLVLNYGMNIPELNGGKTIPRSFQVTNGRDYRERQGGDVRGDSNQGWLLAEQGSPGENSDDSSMRWVYTKPWRYQKSHPLRPELVLERRHLGLYERNGPASVCDYRLLEGHRGGRPREPRVVELGRVDFADWDHDGSLLSSEHGCLYRHALPPSLGEALRAPKLVGDFRDQKFQNVQPTADARRWP